MSYLKLYSIILLLCFININASTYKILKKYGKVENSGGTVIFESKDFSEGDKMFIKVKIDQKCKSNWQYEYYDTSEIFSLPTSFNYMASRKSSSETTVNGAVTLTLYFTIEKKSTEYDFSNGNYLLLNIDCYGKIDFENTEKDGAKSSTILTIVLVVGFFVLFGVVTGIICYCNKKKAALRYQAEMNQQYMMYGNPQMYPQQGNMPIVYGGQPVVIAPNGIPYNNNNSNMQYSNLPYNPGNASMSQINQPPNQKYNMIDQSSDDRGYNSNSIK